MPAISPRATPTKITPVKRALDFGNLASPEIGFRPTPEKETSLPSPLKSIDDSAVKGGLVQVEETQELFYVSAHETDEDREIRLEEEAIRKRCEELKLRKQQRAQGIQGLNYLNKSASRLEPKWQR